MDECKECFYYPICSFRHKGITCKGKYMLYKSEILTKEQARHIIVKYFKNCVDNRKYSIDILQANKELQEALSE